MEIRRTQKVFTTPTTNPSIIESEISLVLGKQSIAYDQMDIEIYQKSQLCVMASLNANQIVGSRTIENRKKIGKSDTLLVTGKQ